MFRRKGPRTKGAASACSRVIWLICLRTLDSELKQPLANESQPTTQPKCPRGRCPSVTVWTHPRPQHGDRSGDGQLSHTLIRLENAVRGGRCSAPSPPSEPNGSVGSGSTSPPRAPGPAAGLSGRRVVATGPGHRRAPRSRHKARPAQTEYSLKCHVISQSKVPNRICQKTNLANDGTCHLQTQKQCQLAESPLTRGWRPHGASSMRTAVWRSQRAGPGRQANGRRRLSFRFPRPQGE